MTLGGLARIFLRWNEKIFGSLKNVNINAVSRRPVSKTSVLSLLDQQNQGNHGWGCHRHHHHHLARNVLRSLGHHSGASLAGQSWVQNKSRDSLDREWVSLRWPGHPWEGPEGQLLALHWGGGVRQDPESTSLLLPSRFVPKDQGQPGTSLRISLLRATITVFFGSEEDKDCGRRQTQQAYHDVD